MPTDEPLLERTDHDYADAFEIRLVDGDGRTAEQFARACLEGAAPALRRLIWVAHRHVLRLRLATRDADGHILGWRITAEERDALRLTASGPLIDAVIVGRRSPDDVVRVVTAVYFTTRPLARLVMTAVAPIHRRVEPRLLQRAVAEG